MMTQQQQQILVRSALAAGVTLAVGLVSAGFAAGSLPERTAGPSAAGAQVAAVSSEPDRPVAGVQAPSFGVPEALPSAPAAPVVAAAFASAAASASEGPVEFVRAFDDEDADYEDDDEDEDEDREHREREGDREALKRAFERREHR